MQVLWCWTGELWQSTSREVVEERCLDSRVENWQTIVDGETPGSRQGLDEPVSGRTQYRLEGGSERVDWRRWERLEFAASKEKLEGGKSVGGSSEIPAKVFLIHFSVPSFGGSAVSASGSGPLIGRAGGFLGRVERKPR